MSTARVFLLAPSLARLIEKEREGRHVRQGYFPDQPDRGTHVQLDEEAGRLVLVSNHPSGPVEEATDIPRSQAQALLELVAGQVEYLEVSLDIGSQTAILRRFLTPAPLDLITVPFEHGKRARKFQLQPWFGPEVTEDPAYQVRSLALSGLPPAPEVEITDAALNRLLDALEGRVGSYQPQATAPQPAAPSKPAEAEDEDDQHDLAIEDSVIRDLARSLSPRRR